MKNYFWVNCQTALDSVYEDENTPLSAFAYLRATLHLMLCPQCSKELKQLRSVEEIMKTDFFPTSPDFEESVMGRLLENVQTEEKNQVPTDLSFRRWIITGFFVIFSLSTVFFGANFIEISNAEGSSFLLPIGLTIGMVLTCYCALFIGSHLKELSTRFKLH